MGETKKQKEDNTQYYDISRILKENALYNIIIGERSNGKTYQAHKIMIDNFIEKGEQGAIIRRWDEDMIGKRGKATFDGIVKSKYVEKKSKGKWTHVKYFSKMWYLMRYVINGKGEKEVVTSEEPFCYGFSLNTSEHDKSSNYDGVTTIVFDEFITRGIYLPDEFVVFQNTLSTIIRQRDNVKIFMLGNTVNKFCPYFAEMGITNLRNMKKDQISVYRFGENGKLTVAVEWSSIPGKKKASDKYFAFNNPKLKMITQGEWEIDIYPHLPEKYNIVDIKFRYFIIFDGCILQGEIIKKEERYFMYIHRKTTAIKDISKDYIFTEEYSNKVNYHRDITKPKDKYGKIIAYFFKNDLVFYQDNEVGELVMNYIQRFA